MLQRVIEKALRTGVEDVNGNEVWLNSNEASQAMRLQRTVSEEWRNALGFDINITTLTGILKSIIEQKFFTIPPADYMPIVVGENAWVDQIMTYQEFNVASEFETGDINTGATQSRLEEADAGIAAVFNPTKDWAKQITWTHIDLMKAARAGNWNLIAAKERSRKMNWDLGIQRVAFLGHRTDSRVTGLLTQSGITSNTTLITGYISSMNAANFSAFVQGVVGAYRLNAAYTAMPNRFTIPEQDFDGLCNLIPGTVGTFPVPMIEYLEKIFKKVTGREDFKIQKCAYADKAQNAAVTGLNKNRYVLYNSNEDTMRMDVTVPYTNTLQNTINGFQYQNVGYGEYTGLITYRPLEVLYFDWG